MSEASGGEWLVPFRGRNYSGAFTQNFLWKRQNVYVMDNHRAALWCWLQHIDPKQRYSLFHVDQHYDTLASRMTTWLDNLPADWGLVSYSLECEGLLSQERSWKVIPAMGVASDGGLLGRPACRRFIHDMRLEIA